MPDGFLSDEEREAIHRPHSVPINRDWRTCPLCHDYVTAIEGIVVRHRAEVYGEGVARGIKFASGLDSTSPVNPYLERPTDE